MAKSTAADRMRTHEEDKEGRRPVDSRTGIGRKKAAITLRSYRVWHIPLKKIKGKPDPVNYEPAEIRDVPGAGEAIREYIVFRGITNPGHLTFRTVELDGTEKDAGDVGYRSTHGPKPPKREPEAMPEFEPVGAAAE